MDSSDCFRLVLSIPVSTFNFFVFSTLLFGSVRQIKLAYSNDELIKTDKRRIKVSRILKLLGVSVKGDRCVNLPSVDSHGQAYRVTTPTCALPRCSS